MKKIIFLILVVCGIFIPLRVNALEGKFYQGEYLSNFYIKKFRNGRGQYQQMRVFRRSDDKAVYCMELWKNLNEGRVLPGYDYDQDVFASLDAATWNRVMLLAYYGYNYINHYEIKWYGITQYMIWKEIEKDSDIYFTDTLNGNRTNLYEDEMNEINDLVNKHNILPSFNNFYTLSLNESISLIDTNNVFDNYNISTTAGLKYIRNGNNLIVTPTKKENSYLYLYKEDNLYLNKPTVYIDDTGQNMLLPGSYTNLYKNIEVYIPTGDIIVNKYDYDTGSILASGDASFKDVEFYLYDINDNLIDSKKIDTNNKIVFKDIPYGKYYVKEVYAGLGYVNKNDDKFYITLDKNNNSVDVYNQVIKNTIRIHKYLKKENGILEEEKAQFKIFNSKNEEVLTFETIDGYYEIDLPYGKYTIKQINGTKNYKYVDDFEIDVSNNLVTQQFDLYNEELTVPIKIIDLDSESKKPILEKNIAFSIINIDTKEEIKLETKSSGQTDIISLVPGIYKITQTKVIDDYEISKEEKVLEINEDNYGFNQEEQEIIFENDKKTSNVEIIKLINYYFNDRLVNTLDDNNISISIYAKNDIYTKDGIIKYSKNQEVDRISKKNNLVSKKLVYGNYYINNPINNEVIDVSLNNSNLKQVKIVEDVYKYGKKIDNVPNTYTKDNNNSYLSLFISLMGFILVYRGIKYEEK